MKFVAYKTLVIQFNNHSFNSTVYKGQDYNKADIKTSYAPQNLINTKTGG